jgi:hypothetical protein
MFHRKLLGATEAKQLIEPASERQRVKSKG